jgi:hypothetical protein
MRRPVRPVAVAVVLAGLVPVTWSGSVAAAGTERAPGARQELSFQDPAIDESSGLLVRGRDVLTVNDSGGEPVVHVVDAASGATVGRTTYAPDVVDVEALAGGPGGAVWVGDIGDNERARSEISLYRIASVSRGDRTVTAQQFDLVYPDGARDAEALLVDPRSGQIHVVSKGTFGGEVFAAPRTLRPGAPNRLRPVARATGLVTDGTYLPDGSAVVLRDYWDAFVVDPETWQERGSFPLPPQRQGEGVASWPVRGPQTRVLVSSEGVNAPLWSVPVPPRLLEGPRDGREDQGSRGRDTADQEADGVDGADDAQRRSTGSSTGPDDAAEPAIPLGPAVAGGALLVALTLGGFWVLRRRVRR